jgi:hypothetical protein
VDKLEFANMPFDLAIRYTTCSPLPRCCLLSSVALFGVTCASGSHIHIMDPLFRAAYA